MVLGRKPYRLSNAAKQDLIRTYRYGLQNFGEVQADKYYSVLLRRFDDIAAAPLKYPSVDHISPGYRRSVCGVDSIYYRLNQGKVEIMRILGAQDTSHGWR